MNLIRSVSASSLLILLSGCATDPTPLNKALNVPNEYIFHVDHPEDSAKLVIVRDRTDPGIGTVRWVLRVDGKIVASIGKGEMLSIDVGAGEHILSIDPDALIKVLQIYNIDQDVKKGRVYYYRAMFDREHYVLRRFNPEMQDER